MIFLKLLSVFGVLIFQLNFFIRKTQKSTFDHFINQMFIYRTILSSFFLDRQNGKTIIDSYI